MISKCRENSSTLVCLVCLRAETFEFGFVIVSHFTTRAASLSNHQPNIFRCRKLTIRAFYLPIQNLLTTIINSLTRIHHPFIPQSLRQPDKIIIMCTIKTTSDASTSATAAEIHCAQCGEPLLHSIGVTLRCGDYTHYCHKSNCVTCLMMEVDDCCFDVSITHVVLPVNTTDPYLRSSARLGAGRRPAYPEVVYQLPGCAHRDREGDLRAP